MQQDENYRWHLDPQKATPFQDSQNMYAHVLRAIHVNLPEDREEVWTLIKDSDYLEIETVNIGNSVFPVVTHCWRHDNENHQERYYLEVVS
tara:strand:- start:701 stop:973 length:273 start_codon:yes stop_codon:yes gene_type:complete